jgi:hypothetical protein
MRRYLKGTRCGRFSVEFQWVKARFVELGDPARIENVLRNPLNRDTPSPLGPPILAWMSYLIVLEGRHRSRIS